MQQNTKKTRQFSTLTPKSLGLLHPLLWAGLVFVLIFSSCENTVVNNGENNAYPDGICGPSSAEISSHGRVAVATEQYGSGGGLTIIDLDSGSTNINVALTHDDVTLRWYDNKIWVLNRYGADNIMILDGNDYHLLKQFSVKIDQNTPCNPHDIAFLDRCKLYVSCYEQPFLLVVNPQADPGKELQGQVDLSDLADDDGIPEASHMKITDHGVWVSIARLKRNNGWIAEQPSYLAKVSPDTDTLEETIPLQGQNPVGPIRILSSTGELAMATAGDWSSENAGIELIDPETKESRMVVSSAQLGGIVSTFTLDASGCGYAVVSTPTTYETAVKYFCLESGSQTIDTCIPFNSYLITDVALTDAGKLIVTDTSSSPAGVRFYDSHACLASTKEPPSDILSTGFSPGFTTPLLLLPPRDGGD